MLFMLTCFKSSSLKLSSNFFVSYKNILLSKGISVNLKLIFRKFLG